MRCWQVLQCYRCYVIRHMSGMWSRNILASYRRHIRKHMLGMPDAFGFTCSEHGLNLLLLQRGYNGQ